MYHHDSLGGTCLWQDMYEVAFTLGFYKYSLIGMLDNLYNASYGGWEFLLEYPDLGKYNRWSQSSHPYGWSEQVNNYKPITIQLSGNSWGGLARSNSSSTCIDGSVGLSDWWYAIGPYTNYNGGVPVNGTVAQVTNLWVRIG